MLSLILVLLTILLYLPVRHHGFLVYDDPDYLTENRIVQQGLTGSGIIWAITSWQADNWHPLTWVSHMLDWEIFGSDAGAQHLVNVLIHALNGVLAFWVLRRWTGRMALSFIVAAVFAWHPLRVQSVAWLSERKDVLCTMFWLATLWAYTEYAMALKDTSRKTKAKFYYGWALVFFFFGLLSKPMIVTLPLVLLLLDYWPLARLHSQGWRFLTREKWPFFVLGGGCCLLTLWAQGHDAIIGLAELSPAERLANCVLALGGYLRQIFWPVGLAVFYPLDTQVSMAEVAGVMLVLLGITVGSWQVRLRRPYLLMGWGWFLITLLPVIGLVRVGWQAHADRYTYIPSLGVLLAIFGEFDAWAWRARWRWRTGIVVVGAVLIACAWGTFHELIFWKDSETLFRRAIEVTGPNAVARFNLGRALEEKGHYAEAAAEYAASVKLNPNLVQAHNNLGNLLARTKQPVRALEEYRVALRLSPKAVAAHVNLAIQLCELRQYGEAFEEFDEASELDPSNPFPPFAKGKALLGAGRSREAVVSLKEALRRDKTHIQSMVLLARVLASDPEREFRDGAEALYWAQRANQATSGEAAFVLDTLAMANAECGRFKEAVETARSALELASTAKDSDGESQVKQHLQCFEKGEPWREQRPGGLTAQ